MVASHMRICYGLCNVAFKDLPSLSRELRVCCRAGSSPQVVLMTDFAADGPQKTPERGSSRLRPSSEAPESQSHEPSTPG